MPPSKPSPDRRPNVTSHKADEGRGLPLQVPFFCSDVSYSPGPVKKGPAPIASGLPLPRPLGDSKMATHHLPIVSGDDLRRRALEQQLILSPFEMWQAAWQAWCGLAPRRAELEGHRRRIVPFTTRNGACLIYAAAIDQRFPGAARATLAAGMPFAVAGMVFFAYCPFGIVRAGQWTVPVCRALIPLMLQLCG